MDIWLPGNCAVRASVGSNGWRVFVVNILNGLTWMRPRSFLGQGRWRRGIDWKRGLRRDGGL
jgi:hypothetical protein